MGSDRIRLIRFRLKLRFQSTLPAWGATISMSRPSADHSDFNPRSPHGERRVQLIPTCAPALISIHAPRMGSDARPADPDMCPAPISIHAPRMGSDRPVLLSLRPPQYFNPRSPHGERRVTSRRLKMYNSISIHAPRMGSDRPADPDMCPAV